MSLSKNTLLDKDDVTGRLKALAPRWRVQEHKLVCEIRFAAFADAMTFMQRVATIAEEMDHHPDWCNRYCTVSVQLTTHSAGGLTSLDFALAARMDDVAQQSGSRAE